MESYYQTPGLPVRLGVMPPLTLCGRLLDPRLNTPPPPVFSEAFTRAALAMRDDIIPLLLFLESENQ